MRAAADSLERHRHAGFHRERCDFELDTFPAIRAWLRRVEQSPGFVTMDWRAEEIDDQASIAAGA